MKYPHGREDTQLGFFVKTKFYKLKGFFINKLLVKE